MTQLRNFISHRTTFEVMFWGCSFLINFLFLGHFHQDYFNTFIFCLCWFPFTIGFTLYLSNTLVKKFLIQKKYFKFILYLIYAILVNTYVQMILVIGCLIVFADLQYNQMNPILNDFSVLWFVQLFISAMYTSLVQIRDEQERKETIHQLEKEKLEIGYQLKELELNTLKEQIHPHFLFNTLNNIYGLAIEKSDDLPKVLLQLSGLLDYLVYQSKEDKVALAKEVKLLQEYIALEQLRLDDRFQLNMHFEGINPEIQITPFLLFPMVENAFKHGIKKTSQSAYLNIITAFHENEFIFEVENSKPQQVEYYKSGGTGLENLKRRLNLYYPNQHQFKIIQNEAFYKAILSIQL